MKYARAIPRDAFRNTEGMIPMQDDSKELLREFEAGDAGQIIRTVLCSGDDWDLDELRSAAEIYELPLSNDKLQHIAILTVNTTVLANSDGSLGYPDNARMILTQIALDLSLCPYHLVDYAICFDDANPACAMIRHIHPGHDS